MTHGRRRLLHGFFRSADLACMVAAFVGSVWFLADEVYGFSAGELLAMRVSVANLLLFAGFLAVWLGCFQIFGLYRSRRLSSRSSEALDVVKATSLGSLIILNVGLFFSLQLLTTQFVGLFWILSSLSSVAVRSVLRSILQQARKRGRNLRDVLIVGTNSRGRRFAEQLADRRELGYRVVGFVDEQWEGMEQFQRDGGKVVCDLSGLPEYLRSQVVDEVVVALPIASAYRDSAAVLRLCEEQGIRVRFLSNFFNLNLARAQVEAFESEPLLLLHSGAAEGAAAIVKRAIDIVVSVALLLLMLPLLVLVALLVKLTSPGPVFFAQDRVGLNKRRFKVYKFRTMVPDAERRLAEIEHLNEASGPVFKIKNDPRITPLGYLLRRTSIDELPQLWNVLNGDMSLVGPRPLPVRDYAAFDQDWHRRRFSVRPGVTCLWQISGRSSLPFERWMELDLEYIDRWSLWLDFKILMRTIPAVLRGTGAS